VVEAFRAQASRRQTEKRSTATLAHPSATSPFRAEKGTLRVITLAPSLEYLVAKSLDELRLSAARNVTVLRQVLLVTPRARGTVHARLGSRRNWRPFDRWILRPRPDQCGTGAQPCRLLAHREIRVRFKINGDVDEATVQELVRKSASTIHSPNR
jgi:hypothetical protein